jgi:hypothetical protein
MTTEMYIPSEMLEPIFAIVIGTRFRIATEEARGDSAAVATKMLTVLETLGDVARVAGATHCSLACSNDWGKLKRRLDRLAVV